MAGPARKYLIPLLLGSVALATAAEPGHWVVHIEEGLHETREKRGKNSVIAHPLEVLLSAGPDGWQSGVAVVPLDPDRPTKSFTAASHRVTLADLPASAPPARIPVVLVAERTGNPSDPFAEATARDLTFDWRREGGRWVGTCTWQEDDQQHSSPATAEQVPAFTGPGRCLLRFEGALGPMTRHYGAPSRLLLEAAITTDGAIGETSIRGSYGGWSVDSTEGALQLDDGQLTGTVVFQPESRHSQYDDRFTLQVEARIIADRVVGSFTGHRDPLPEGERSKSSILAHDYAGDIVGRILRPKATP